MLLEYVGEDVFLRGVSMYLKKHLYANSVSRDLWDAIGEAAGVDITDMMQTWMCKVGPAHDHLCVVNILRMLPHIVQIGFPVITVQETANSIIIRQDRFLETGRAEEKDNQTIWCGISEPKTVHAHL